MGSMNFGLFPMLKRYKEFKYDWEPAMLEGSHDLVFRNSFKDIRYALETLNSPARATNSSATTPAISTICITSGPKVW